MNGCYGWPLPSLPNPPNSILGSAFLWQNMRFYYPCDCDKVYIPGENNTVNGFAVANCLVKSDSF